MPLATLLSPHGESLRDPVEGTEAEDLLWAAGGECGRWAPSRRPVSCLPQLNHAAELLALQRRFGSVVTQRRRGSHPGATEEHVHDDHELRVVLDGELHLLLRSPTLGGWLQLRLQPLEWVALPPRLPHAELPAAADVLCLYTRPGGWHAQRTRAAVPSTAPVATH